MRIPVLVLTLFEEPSMILKTMRSKASGYLILAKTKREELISAIYAAKNNQIVLGSHAWSVLQTTLYDKVNDPQTLEMPGLGSRELQVLRLLAEGFSNKEIADRLSIGKRTVEVHVAHILTKLGVTSRTGAVAYVWRRLLANNSVISLSDVSRNLS